MTGPIRVGVVGAGWWSGFAHLPAIAAHPDARLVVVADRDPDRAQEAARLFGADHATTSLDAVLAADLDAAVVATPQDAHHEPAARLLDAGVDVLVEKPLTVDPTEAWDLVGRAERSGARLHVGHTFLHSPVVAALRRDLADDRLGDLLLCSALFATAVARLYRGQPDFAQQDTGAPFPPRATTYADPASGGQLFSQLSHAVAVVLFVTGDVPLSVSGYEQTAGLPVDLSDALSCRMGSGALATWATTGSVLRNDLRREEYRFFGTGGQALLDTVAATLTLATGDGEPDVIRLAEPDLPREPVRNLVDAALGRTPVVVPGSLGARVIDVLSAARQSARRGVAVRVDDRAAGAPT